MNPYWSALARELKPYVPGEQPTIAGLVKLNTNESPYPPSPKALAAIREAAGEGLRLYPDPEAKKLRETLADPDVQRDLFGETGVPPLLAVHAGGRSVLDAVEHALAVPPEALADSRAVLRRFGNMSSATILFVLADMMARGVAGQGIAIAFGPGLAAEAIRFDSGGIGA